MEIEICMKMDLALNNLQWLVCHKTKPDQNTTEIEAPFCPAYENEQTKNQM